MRFRLLKDPERVAKGFRGLCRSRDDSGNHSGEGGLSKVARRVERS